MKGKNQKYNNRKVPARQYYSKHTPSSASLVSPPNTTKTTQQNIHSFTIKNDRKFPAIFGETIVGKEHGVCRIVSQNVGCIGVQSFANNKIRTAIQWLYRNHVGICGWQEIGIINHKLQRHERLHEHMRDPRHHAMRISTGTYTHDDIDRFQCGGTVVMSFDLLANMTKSTHRA